MAGEKVDGFHISTGAQLFSTAHSVAVGLCEELGVPFDCSPRYLTSGFYNRRKDGFGVPDPSSRINLANLKTILAFGLFSPNGHLQMLRFGRMLSKRRDDLVAGNPLRLLDLDLAGSFGEFARKEVGQEFVEEFCEFPVASFMLSHPERISPLHGMMLLWLTWFERRHAIRMPEQGG